MIKHKKIILGLIVSFIIIVSLVVFDVGTNAYVLQNKKSSIKNNNMMSILLETQAGSGEYSSSSDNSWPTSGYEFNSELSRCVNGGTLTWDSTNNKVMFDGEASDKCYVYFNKIIFSVAIRNKVLSTAIKKYYNTESSLLYHDANLTNGANDNSYRYSGGDYSLTDKAINAGIAKIDDNLIVFYCNSSKYGMHNGCNHSFYYMLSYNSTDKYDNYIAAAEQAVNDGYLTKNNVRNFVCFGTDATTCPTDNLYRIIGYFDGKMKLIKYTFSTADIFNTNNNTSTCSGTHNSSSFESARYDYPFSFSDCNWDSVSNFWWEKTGLNRNTLNTGFMNYISNYGDKWINSIFESTWVVDNQTVKDTMTGLNTYNAERQKISNTYGPSNAATKTDGSKYSTKFGLMYASDYAFAATQSSWNTSIGTLSNFTEKNWLYSGITEWTMSYAYSSGNIMRILGSSGSVDMVYVTGTRTETSIRPVFYLNPDVKIVSGDGTYENPYRIFN